MSERIDRAAIKWKGVVHTVPRPGRHHTVIHEMAERGFGPECMGNQGFVTDKGEFVDRFVACRIAYRAGQIIQKTGPINILFSEDMW